MKLLKAVARSFKNLTSKWGRKPPDAKLLCAQDYKEAVDKIVNSLPQSKEPVTKEKIEIDAAALLMTLFSDGYMPSQIFELLARTYGSIMAASPDVFIREDGKTATREQVEAGFLSLCVIERQQLSEIARIMMQPSFEKGTMH